MIVSYFKMDRQSLLAGIQRKSDKSEFPKKFSQEKRRVDLVNIKLKDTSRSS